MLYFGMYSLNKTTVIIWVNLFKNVVSSNGIIKMFIFPF